MIDDNIHVDSQLMESSHGPGLGAGPGKCWLPGAGKPAQSLGLMLECTVVAKIVGDRD